MDNIIKIKPSKGISMESYIDDFIINSEKPKTKSHHNTIRDDLNKTLENIKLEEINSELLINMDFEDRIYTGALFCRFIGYLYTKQLVVDPKLSRIVDYRSSLYKECRKGKLASLLSSNIFERYKKEFGTTKESVSLFLKPIQTIEDKRFNDCIRNYIDRILLSPDYSNSTKASMIDKINYIISSFFSNYEDSLKIHSHDVIEFIELSRNTDTSLITLVKILIELFHYDLISDGVLNRFISEVIKVNIGRLLSPLKNSKLLDLLPLFTGYSVLLFKEKSHQIILINVKNEDLRLVMINYINNKYVYVTSEMRELGIEFQNSLGTTKIESLEDISLDEFEKQVKYFKKNALNYKTIRFLIYFYQYFFQNMKYSTKEIPDTRVFSRKGLAVELYENYQIILYQPIENVPLQDKWILFYNENQCSNEGITSHMTSKLDFTVISHQGIKDAVKDYIWSYPSSINVKTNNLYRIIPFINFCENFSRSKVTSIRQQSRKNPDISIEEIIAYKSHFISNNKNNRTITGNIYIIREFLNHVSDNGLLNVDEGYKHYLNHIRDTTYSDTNPINEKHFKLIIHEMKNRANLDDLNKLYLGIFYLLTATELRPSNIISLHRDCVKTKGRGIYVIESKTKVSKNEIIQTSITEETKIQIDKIIKLSDKIRTKNPTDKNNKYLFIYKNENNNRVLSLVKFNNYMREICIELGVPEYTASNLRDTHMTMTENFIINKSYSNIQKNILSGHKSIGITDRHYVKTEIEDTLAATEGIVVGEIEDTRTNKSSLNKIIPYNEILLNENFVTTPDFIPFYRNEIKRIDKEMEECNSLERLEEMLSYHALLKGYLEEIKDISSK